MILEKPLATTIVYFLSTDQLGVHFDESVYAHIRKDMAKGYRLKANLHNHPFQLNNPTGDIGAVTAPSGDRTTADVFHLNRMVREFGMEEGWITNGFNSITLSKKRSRRNFEARSKK